MNETLFLTEIKSYLARLKTEVTISNASNETDINIHAENIISRILMVLFNCRLTNSNRALKRNQESFDLFDLAGEYAFQVTSTNVNTKIINSITSFLNYSWNENFKQLYIILIGYDKKQYNKATINKIDSIVRGKIPFTTNKNILDLNDLYELVKDTNNIQKIAEIKTILKEQFESIEKTDDINNSLINFLDEYKASIFVKYRRINFFGLDVSSKPHEVDLENLFVASYFKKHSKAVSSYHSIKDNIVNHSLSSNELKSPQLQENNTADKLGITDLPGIKISSGNNYPTTINYSTFENILTRISFLNYGLEEEKYTLQNFFSFINHTVILGKPGAGKSSLIKYITLKILKKNAGIFNNDDALDYFPFRIELYKYNQSKKANSDNILSYLLSYLQQDLSVKSISKSLLAHILSKMNCLIFFDGLDEIFDIQDRIDVRDDIEIFTKSHSKSKIVITSRFESNTEVPFDINYFSVFEVEGFNDEQINSYIQKWYSIVEHEEIYKNEEVEKFSLELKKLDIGLIQNPLLLTLILIIYKNERELPTSKFDIYKGCTNTIVDTRDRKEKRINFETSITNKIGVFSSLAFWQFTLENRRKQVTSNVEVIRYLTSEVSGDFEDIDLAEVAIKEFLNFAKIRSIYFENSFTHKTFLEYFTSHYIYSEYFLVIENRETLNLKLKNDIGSASWSVIFELLFCEIDAQVRNSKIIDTFINQLTIDNNIKSINFFLQIIIYLKNISQNIIIILLTRAYTYCFDEDNNKTNNTDASNCFENICALIITERFRKACIESYSQLIPLLSSKFEKTTARLFLHELILYTNVDFSAHLDKTINNENIDNPYELILVNFTKMEEWTGYFDILGKFIIKFGHKNASKNYDSLFYKYLFGENKYFNWISNALFSHGDIRILGNNYRKLRSLGFNKHHIVSALSKITIENRFELTELSVYEKQTSDDTLRKVLQMYIEMAFPESRIYRKSNYKTSKKIF